MDGSRRSEKVPEGDWSALARQADGETEQTESRSAKRKRRAEEKAAEEGERVARPERAKQPSNDPEASPSESEQAAEAIERKRIADRRDRMLAALAERFGGTWELERGRYTYAWLTHQEQLTRDGQSVVVSTRLKLHRPPNAPPPTPSLAERVTELLDPEESAEENAKALALLMDKIPEGDVLSVSWQSPEGVEQNLVINPETERKIFVSPERQATGTAQSAEQDGQAKSESPVSDVIEREVLRVPPAELSVPSVDGQKFDHFLAQIWQEPEPAESDRPAASNDLQEMLDELAKHADRLVELPPIGGGADIPEMGSESIGDNVSDELPERPFDEPSEEPPSPSPPPAEEPECPEPPADPQRARRPVRRPTRSVGRPLGGTVNVLERHWADPRPRPDSELRNKARKLIRMMASEYGIRLTPELEAYLLAILLRPHRIGRRSVLGLGLNREHFLAVLSVIKLNFQANRPLPPS